MNSNNSRGSVLVLSLWSVTLLAIWAIAAAAGVQQRIRVYERWLDRDRIHLMNDSMYKRVCSELAAWPAGRITRENERFYRTLGIPLVTETEEGQSSYILEDETAKLNINRCPVDILKNLLRLAAHMDEAHAWSLAGAIVDYRDPDDLNVLTGVDQERRGAREPLKNAPFELLPEVLNVDGMDKEFYSLIEKYITIYGNGEININRAEPEVLRAMEMPEGLIQKVIGYREGSDHEVGTDDDGLFLSKEEIVPKLGSASELTEEERSYLVWAVQQRKFGIASSYFKVRCRAELNARNAEGVATFLYGLGRGVEWWSEN